MMFDNYKTELEKRIKEEKKEEKYRKSPKNLFKKELNIWWSKWQEHYYWRRTKDNKFAAYMTVCFSPFDFVEELENQSIKIVAFAVHEELREQGVGKYLFDGICRDADLAGCAIYLVANAFNVRFLEEPKKHLDFLTDHGIGFSEIFFQDELRQRSKRLQNWYINNFGFQRCTYPQHTCVFKNRYLEKKAQLIRIPDTAKPEVKEKLKKFTR